MSLHVNDLARNASKVSTMRVLIPLALAFALLIFSSSSAFAQASAPANAPAKSGQPPKKTSVNFEDQLIEGQTQKPELFYLLQQRNNNFKRLIKLRENFLPEMRKTSEGFGRRTSSSGTPAAGKK